MAKRLLLINPCVYGKDAKLNFATVLRLEPACLPYLAALTPPDWEIRIVDENIEAPTSDDADLVGLTAYTCNAPRAYEISAQYRQKGIKTVMGGVHASMLPDEATRYVDSVVIGEAESVWQSLLHDFESEQLKRVYRGDRISLDNLPKSRRELLPSKYRYNASVEAARGCPMDCEFCSVTTLNGRTYRQRPVDQVLDELEALDCRDVLFSDDNILGYGRNAEERAIQLFRGMIDRGLNKRWVAQAGIDFANNSDILKYAKQSGCLAVMIGFESINEESLRGMSKVRNLKVGVENYRDVVKRIHGYGIGIVGAFVFGGDGDRKDVFERTIEFIWDSKVDTAQLTILTPLPGTRLYDRLRKEERLLRTEYPEDWRHYDFSEAVFRPQHMTPDELEEGGYQVCLQTGSRMASLRRAISSTLGARSLYLGAVSYSYNRSYRQLALRKWKHMKSAPSRMASYERRTSQLMVEESAERELVGKT